RSLFQVTVARLAARLKTHYCPRPHGTGLYADATSPLVRVGAVFISFGGPNHADVSKAASGAPLVVICFGGPAAPWGTRQSPQNVKRKPISITLDPGSLVEFRSCTRFASGRTECCSPPDSRTRWESGRSSSG